jgi:hypothetical protein
MMPGGADPAPAEYYDYNKNRGVSQLPRHSVGKKEKKLNSLLSASPMLDKINL